MVTNIWTWSLLGFAVVHFLGGLIAWLNFRRQRFTWSLPLIFTFLGLLIPLTAGIITGEVWCALGCVRGVWRCA